jgi:hypothetical protein
MKNMVNTGQPWKLVEFKDKNLHTPDLGVIFASYLGASVCTCDACSQAEENRTKAERSVYADLDWIPPHEIYETNEAVFALCARNVYGYVLKERQWRE